MCERMKKNSDCVEDSFVCGGGGGGGNHTRDLLRPLFALVLLGG